MDIVSIDKVEPFTTKDGSEIRELLAYRNSCIRNQSLAEARLPPGRSTAGHHHVLAEEIYYLLEGEGLMEIGGEQQPVAAGDAIAIPPGAFHRITNTGQSILKFLCCWPAYEHHDTTIWE